MPKINVYLPDDLADAVRDTGIPVSAVCQQALEQAVRRVTAVRAVPPADLDAEQLAARLPHLTARLRDVLLRARDQARAACAAEVGTGHLLAALLDEGDNLGVRVLRTIDVSPAHLTTRLATDSATGDAAATVEATGPATRWSAAGAGALELAVTEATALGHNYVGCEHLLLGLVAEPDGAAGRVLRESGADLRATRRAVAAALVGYAHLRAQTAGAFPASGGVNAVGGGLGTGAAPVGADAATAVAALVRRELVPVLARLERLEQRAGVSAE
ncbi:Clp protease N-terminal domain-containing protein [Solwaraspora sp. WMMD791]|uniref:Clp protease N-terminal domain-containing protein n=1 Tax=Solwaraspora sp. WMMD791 TaxID=3016086 RepID=UPI00249A8A44|nr:Clp protease N-terminal domain-containing protein [Solwaraspora sp. WMMD791]WFE28522.1 Clp protease N-terminal domain-containing protein [Solwaraspora sp. WMMD791]